MEMAGTVDTLDAKSKGVFENGICETGRVKTVKIRYSPAWVGTCSQMSDEHGGEGALGASTYDA